jgi:hypothetical protein
MATAKDAVRVGSVFELSKKRQDQFNVAFSMNELRQFGVPLALPVLNFS